LLDTCTPALQKPWLAKIRNGDLIAAAEESGFEYQLPAKRTESTDDQLES
jgi:hypothetical protein